SVNRQLFQPRGVTRLIAERCGSVVVRVAPLPVRQDDRLGTCQTNFFSQSETVFVRGGQAGIAESHADPGAGTHHRTRGLRFFSAKLRCPPGCHLALCEVQNAHGVPLGGHFEECSRASQLHIVGMSGYSQNIYVFHRVFTFSSNSASSTRYLK